MRILSDIADISAGYPFRGKIKPTETPNASVIQLSDLALGEPVKWARLIGTDVTPRTADKFLEKGDILFVSRGRQYFAVVLDDVPGKVVCAQHLLRLRLNDPSKVLPEYVVWQLNHEPLQSRIKSHAAGSNQLAVSAKALRALPFPVPPVEQQLKLVELSDLCTEEEEVLKRLIRNRQEQLDAAAIECFTRYVGKCGEA